MYSSDGVDARPILSESLPSASRRQLPPMRLPSHLIGFFLSRSSGCRCRHQATSSQARVAPGPSEMSGGKAIYSRTWSLPSASQARRFPIHCQYFGHLEASALCNNPHDFLYVLTRVFLGSRLPALCGVSPLRLAVCAKVDKPHQRRQAGLYWSCYISRLLSRTSRVDALQQPRQHQQPTRLRQSRRTLFRATLG